MIDRKLAGSSLAWSGVALAPGLQRARASITDLEAGLSLAAFVIPESLAYASLAQLPPITGLYCYLVAGVAYALFGTSRQLAVGPTSALALVVAASVAALGGGDPARAVALALLGRADGGGDGDRGPVPSAWPTPLISSPTLGRIQDGGCTLYRLHPAAQALRHRRRDRKFL